MRSLQQACAEYYHAGYESFEYTTPMSGNVTVNTADGRFKQEVSIEEGKLKFGNIEKLD